MKILLLQTVLKNKKFSKKSKHVFKSDFTKESYMETVEKVRQYIRNGDIYITNLTQTFTCEIKKKPSNIYKVLRELSPAPFSAYMNFDEFFVLSSSMERFLKIKNRIVETRPIKGTRPRGKTEKEDKKI